MFTGIINHLGIIKNIQNQGYRLFEIGIENFTSDLAIGASVACSGVCLTVISKTSDSFSVQVSNETLDRTTLANWQPGKKINLERALKLGDELGGHLVSGHVDTVGELKDITQIEQSHKLTFAIPSEFAKFVAEKGSITIDGVSLTVNQVENNLFAVNIIPHTFQETTLGQLQIGDKVNLEIDLIARYLARLVQG